MHALKTAGYLDDTIFYIEMELVREATDEVEKMMWKLCIKRLEKARNNLIEEATSKIDRSTIKL